MHIGRVTRTLAIILTGVVATGSADATSAPKRSGAAPHAVRKPSKPVLTAESYAKQVAHISSCADFEELVWLADEATPLLKRLFVNPIASKSEFETTDAYTARLVAGVNAKVGDGSRIYTVVPVSDSYASYDADRAIMTIDFGDYRSETTPLTETLDSWGETTRSYTASNSFGVKRLVKSFSGFELRGRFKFARDDLPTKLQAPMSAAEAKRFKNNNGWLHVLSTLDGYATDLEHLDATITHPVEVITYYRDVTLIPRCAVITSGPNTLDGWRLDRWNTD